MSKNYGYVRVSTKEQNETRQVIALENIDVELTETFMDKQSGKDFDRPAYKRLMRKLRKGDLLVVKSIDLVLQILSYVAQFEREAIHQRQAEGIAAAKSRGVKFGRKRKDITEEFYEAVQRYESGEFSLRKAAKLAMIPYTTFRRKYIEEKEKKIA